MQTPQELAAGKSIQLCADQIVIRGFEVVGAPGFEPTSGIHAVPQSDHNLLTNKLQLAAVENPSPTDSAAKPQPGDSKTHNLYAESMPMTGYETLARVVAGWPSLSPEEQQRILAIVQGKSPA